MFGSSAWKRSSFLGGETGPERGHGFLGFHNEPVVEPAESWVLARRPPHLSRSSPCQEAVQRGLCPLSKAAVSSVGRAGHPGCVGAGRAHHGCVMSSGVCARAR